jgi:hypothetical protein
MNRFGLSLIRGGAALLVVGAGLLGQGCEQDSLVDPGRSQLLPEGAPQPAAPAGLAPISFLGEELTLWPYTGASFDGTPSDPINLVFVGKVDPISIRAALLSLDGNRPGLPPVYPFTATWEEAIGNVQATYTADGGWGGSVIQLQLGSYDPIRFHLRLFGTGVPYGDEGEWVLGAAHLDVLIPGTTDHQVLSWDLPAQLVVADLIRSGLLDPGAPVGSTGPISQTPTFRVIPAVIYNALPAELIALVQGPPQPVAADVPLPNSGAATILNLGTAPVVVPGSTTSTLHVDFGQVVPRPFCMQGPFDYLYVTGPVDFVKTAEVTADGAYRMTSTYTGALLATPVDVTQSPPQPIGEPFRAKVGGNQNGTIDGAAFHVMANDRRLTLQSGPERELTRFRIGSGGGDTYERTTKCLTETP